jgi:hypothetical protein
VTTERNDFRDWFVVIACLVCQIGMGVGGYLFPVFLKPVSDDLGWSRTVYAVANPIMSTAWRWSGRWSAGCRSAAGRVRCWSQAAC